MNDSNVKNTYEQIAEHFDSTRQYVWPTVKNFVDKFEPNSLVADIGCGNGKNMYREDCFNLGFDFCQKFTEICKIKDKEIVVADNLNIPLKSNLFDYVLSVAVIHHFSSIEKRKKAINELMRILKIGGKAFISVWAKKQPEKSKRQFTKSDNMVEWNKFGKKYYRYYHIFDEDELYQLCKNYNIIHYEYSCGNWSIILEKN